MKAASRKTLGLAFFAGTLLAGGAVLLGPACSTEEGCQANTANVRVTVPDAVHAGGPLVLTAEVANTTQVIASASRPLDQAQEVRIEVAFPPGGYPASDTHLVVQVFARRGGIAGPVVATGIAEVIASPGCFNVIINLLGVPDAGAPPDASHPDGGAIDAVSPTDGPVPSSDGPIDAETDAKPDPSDAAAEHDSFTPDAMQSPHDALSEDASLEDAMPDTALEDTLTSVDADLI